MAEGLPTLRKARYAAQHGRVVGEGAYRIVYRSKRGKWVYKFNLRPSKKLGSNAEEWKTYLKHKDTELPKGVYFPEMYMLNGGIIAAQFIKGRHPENECYRDYHTDDCPGIDKCWAERIKYVKVSDVHYANVLITKDGDIYLVDLGHGETYPESLPE